MKISKIVSILLFAAVLALAGVSKSQAAFVTTNETALDAIYGQTSFGSSPVDIRFNSTIVGIDPIGGLDLLNIGSLLDIQTLFNFNESNALPGNTVYMYFVDTIDWCGSFDTSIVGCATTPGHDLVVESSFAASGFGPELLAHELGHNLGLPHPASGGAPNLMDGFLNDNTDLTVLQVGALFGSSLVQGDQSSGFFIDITPVLVVAEQFLQPVPIPPAAILFLSGIAGLVVVGRRKSAKRA